MSGVSFRFAWQRAIRDSRLAASRKLVAYTLAMRMDVAGSTYLSLRRLARESSLSRTTVIAAIGELEAAGWVATRRGGGRKNVTEYRATVPETVQLLDSFSSETVQLATRNGSVAGPVEGIEDVKRLIETDCTRCGRETRCVDLGDEVLCLDCAGARAC